MPETPFGKDIASNKVEVSKGDVLLCKINPHLNRVWIVSDNVSSYRKLASSEWIVVRIPKELYPNYLALCFQSPYFRDLMMSNVSGVGGSLMRAQPSAVKKYMIPLPPHSEQIKIVKVANELTIQLNEIASTLI